VSFLDNLENNLKALESRDEGMDDGRRREKDRGRALAVSPWSERLKREPYGQNLMREATIAGRTRRIKVNLAWIETTLRLEARGHRLELRPTMEGVRAVFLHGGKELESEPVDLAGDPANLTNKWMAILDEQKRIDDADAPAVELED
jgi:hypothetical protein